jgi:uncharacterized protein YegL
MLDCSGSMRVNGKIQALNNAIREALPHMRRVAAENPNADVLVRALTFSTGATWVVADPTPVEEFFWTDVMAGGVTDLGAGLTMVAEQLRVPPMSMRALPPVVVLVTDGQPTDDYTSGLHRILDEPWGARAVRIAIAIGRDADHDVLQQFIASPERRPISARSPEDLVRQLRWASTVVVRSVSTAVGAPGAVPPPDALPSAPKPVGEGDQGFAGLTW